MPGRKKPAGRGVGARDRSDRGGSAVSATTLGQLAFDFAPLGPGAKTESMAAGGEVAAAAQAELAGQLVMPWATPPDQGPASAKVPARAAMPAAPRRPAASTVPPMPRSPGPYDSVTDLTELAGLAAECRQCGLRAGCRGVVFGEGAPKARVMLVGEGPGQVEDDLGRPFVGPAGKLLDRILGSVGFAREEVYIANVVKCRPPGNRIPLPEERAACRPWLEAQIRIIGPAFLVCLGASAAQSLIDPDARITRIRGKLSEKDGLRILPTYHPAALLRDESKKRPVWEDFKLLRAEYDRLFAPTPGP